MNVKRAIEILESITDTATPAAIRYAIEQALKELKEDETPPTLGIHVQDVIDVEDRFGGR
jgi:uncharacterized protein (UPF0147 family)